MWVVPFADRFFNTGDRWLSLLLVGILSLACLCLISIFFGPLGANIPRTTVRGIFFAEWKFVYFVFYDALPMSIVGALLNRWDKG